MADCEVAVILISLKERPEECPLATNYLTILGKPIILHTLQEFNELPFVQRIALVTESELSEEWALTRSVLSHEKVTIVHGGKSHFRGIQRGLVTLLEKDTNNNLRVVLVHDASRPLVPDTKWLMLLIEEAKRSGAAGPVVPLVSTVLQQEPCTFLSGVLDRNQYGSMELPQAFLPDVLLSALCQCTEHDFESENNCLKLVKDHLKIRPKLIQGSTELQRMCFRKDFHAAAKIMTEKNNKVLILAAQPMVALLQLADVLRPRTSTLFCSSDPRTELHYSVCKKFKSCIVFITEEYKYSLIKSAHSNGWLDEKPGVVIVVKQHDADIKFQDVPNDIAEIQDTVQNPEKAVVVVNQKRTDDNLRLVKLICNLITAETHSFGGQTFYI